MLSQSLPRKPKANRTMIHCHPQSTVCSICYRPVSLQQSKTDEHGQAVHGKCYLLKLRLKQKSSEGRGALRRRRSAGFNNRKRPGALPAWIQRLWIGNEGHNVAEYTLIFAVIVMVVVSTIRL